MAAPASRTKEAAIWVTAKARRRRVPPPVIRALPLDRLIPFGPSPDGRRGTNARSAAAASASPAPTHSMLESTVRSSARTENRDAYRARIATMGRALSTPSAAPAPQSRRLSASRTRRSAAVLAPSAGPNHQLAFAANRPRQNQVGHIGTGDDEDQSRRGQQHPKHGPGFGRNLVAQKHRVNAEVRLRRIRLGMLFHDGAVCRPELGAGLFQRRAGGQPAKQLGHAMDPARHHRRRQVVWTGHHVGDDLGFGRIRDGWLQYPYDGRCTRSERFQPDDFSEHRSGRCAARCVQKRYVRTTAPAAAGPSSRISSSRPSTGCRPITSK